MDTISRQAAIDALKEHRKLFCDNTPKTFRRLPYHEKCRVDEIDTAIATLVNLPSAQPEIIRCKDCKYRDENWRRVSVRWLPCMDVRTGSNWYCGSAERER